MSEKSSKIKKLVALGAVALLAVTAGTLVNKSLQEDTDKTQQESKTESSTEKQVIKQVRADIAVMAEGAAKRTAQQAAEKQASQAAQNAANNNQSQEVVASAGNGSGQAYVADNGGVQGGYVQSGGQPVTEVPAANNPAIPAPHDHSQYGYTDDVGAMLNDALDDPNNYLTLPDGSTVYRGPGTAGLSIYYNE